MIILLILNACFCVQPSPPTPPVNEPIRDTSFEKYSGAINNGIYRDAHFLLHGEISDEWEVGFGFEFALKRAVFTHIPSSTTVEVWRFPYPMVEPAPLDFCRWSFIDLGLYGRSSTGDPRVVATCFPSTADGSIVFGILRHRRESTWQFKIHTSAQNMLYSKLVGEELLMKLYWNADEEPVYKRR